MIGLVAVVVMASIAATLGPARLVAGDAHYLFAAARSLAFDGDLDLTNQYWVMGDRWGLGRDPTDDHWRLPVRELGPSLVMVPGLWLHWGLGASPTSEPVFACLGAAASLGLAWLGCVRSIDALALAVSDRQVEWLAAAAVFGFVVPFYAVGSAGYPHGIDATIGAWLVAALVGRKPPVWIGALLACAVLTRLQNLIWLVWPLVEWLRPDPRTGERDRGMRVAVIAAITMVGLVPQVWLGLAHPGSERGALGWTLGFFNLDDYLRDLVRVVGGVHGLVRWTPIAALALVGLVVPRERRAWPALLVLAGFWLLFASVRDVDGGDAFGARRFAGAVGLLAIGLASLRVGLSRNPARALAITLALLVAANLIVTGLAISQRVSLAAPNQVRGTR